MDQLGDPAVFLVATGTALIENQDSTWIGELENFSSAPYERLGLAVESTGAYDGLTAIIDPADRQWNEFRGVVFDGGMPPVPDQAARSAE